MLYTYRKAAWEGLVNESPVGVFYNPAAHGLARASQPCSDVCKSQLLYRYR
jgi:hypothetical protein